MELTERGSEGMLDNFQHKYTFTLGSVQFSSVPGKFYEIHVFVSLHEGFYSSACINIYPFNIQSCAVLTLALRSSIPFHSCFCCLLFPFFKQEASSPLFLPALFLM